MLGKCSTTVLHGFFFLQYWDHVDPGILICKIGVLWHPLEEVSGRRGGYF